MNDTDVAMKLQVENAQLKKALEFLAHTQPCYKFLPRDMADDWCNKRKGKCEGCISDWAMSETAK
jgi:hypothetical protein